MQRVNAWTAKQAAKGHPYVQWDADWERMEYLHFEKGVNEKFGTSWEQKFNYTPSGAVEGAGGPGHGDDDAQGGHASQPSAKAKAAGKKAKKQTGGKQSEEPSDGGDPGKKNKGAKHTNPTSWLTHVRSSFAVSCNGAEHLLLCIGSDAKWEWANNEHITKDLRVALKHVRDLVAENPFIRDALSMTVNETKKTTHISM